MRSARVPREEQQDHKEERKECVGDEKRLSISLFEGTHVVQSGNKVAEHQHVAKMIILESDRAQHGARKALLDCTHKTVRKQLLNHHKYPSLHFPSKSERKMMNKRHTFQPTNYLDFPTSPDVFEDRQTMHHFTHSHHPIALVSLQDPFTHSWRPFQLPTAFNKTLEKSDNTNRRVRGSIWLARKRQRRGSKSVSVGWPTVVVRVRSGDGRPTVG
ncbi:hypothetical protein L1987_01433 [Smallanthus sonchifolius]|uniref:Uncharacterized protein n=1 Tax=Smallanthus sonchifolius TaxID=185202 RepID=A0ACB9K5A7_9ASTR|nr:hypothetical protein L1987_01433 [Smallanthus sonchifolius]